MCKVARKYEVKFFRFVQQSLSMAYLTKLNLFITLKKYNTSLKDNGTNFFKELILRHNEDCRKRRGCKSEIDDGDLQQAQLESYLRHYSANILDDIGSRVLEDEKDQFTGDIVDKFTFSASKEETSEDTQYNFMIRYCLSEKMTKKFVEVRITSDIAMLFDTT